MIIWGGATNTTYFNTGGRYCAATSGGTPTPTPTATPTPTPTPGCAHEGGPVRKSEAPNPPKVAAPPQIIHSQMGNMSLTWTTCGACPENAEVTVSGDSISMGVPNRPAGDMQNIAVHGAAALLPPAAHYTITFTYELSSWDSYCPLAGFWDSFSVSVANQPYWELSLADPVTNNSIPGLAFIGGGQTCESRHALACHRDKDCDSGRKRFRRQLSECGA